MSQNICDECGSSGWPDFIIEYHAWEQISPNGDDGGLLCPTCILVALEAKEIKCLAAVSSNHVRTVSMDLMYVARAVENIELAIGGRKNAAWAGIRKIAKAPS